MTATGIHNRKVWTEALPGRTRSGFSCAACHKTWEWRGDALVETRAAA